MAGALPFLPGLASLGGGLGSLGSNIALPSLLGAGLGGGRGALIGAGAGLGAAGLGSALLPALGIGGAGAAGIGPVASGTQYAASLGAAPAAGNFLTSTALPGAQLLGGLSSGVAGLTQRQQQGSIAPFQPLPSSGEDLMALLARLSQGGNVNFPGSF
jgi:hypothetical protein